jgi:uncharacterized protein
VTAAGVESVVVGFSRALRAAGVPVGVDQSATFAQALALVDPASRSELYLAARATLVFRREDMPVFDAIFGAFWSGRSASPARPQKVPRAPRHDRGPETRTAFGAYMAQRARADDPEVDVPETEKAASSLEVLQRKDFGELTAEELRSLETALGELRFEPARRVTRRLIAARRGERLDPRRALRLASRHGGTLPVLPRRARKIKRRPLVVLADISGSMEIYSRILLQFFHGLTRIHPLTETFVFGTRLTCITPELRLRSVDEALDRASAAIVDFAGGTRIGESLRTFHRLHAGRVLRSGTVVLLVSDGWETGDVKQLQEETRRLQRACHRLIWLNPLLGRSTYRPFTAGMAAALAYVDDFLPIHSLQSLRDLSAHLSRLPAGRGTRGSRAVLPPGFD